MENFEVNIRQYKYIIKFESEPTLFKKLDLCIHRISPSSIWSLSEKLIEEILERKMYYGIRRRIYNNISNIYKLK